MLGDVDPSFSRFSGWTEDGLDEENYRKFCNCTKSVATRGVGRQRRGLRRHFWSSSAGSASPVDPTSNLPPSGLLGDELSGCCAGAGASQWRTRLGQSNPAQPPCPGPVASRSSRAATRHCRLWLNPGWETPSSGSKTCRLLSHVSRASPSPLSSLRGSRRLPPRSPNPVSARWATQMSTMLDNRCLRRSPRSQLAVWLKRAMHQSGPAAAARVRGHVRVQ